MRIIGIANELKLALAYFCSQTVKAMGTSAAKRMAIMLEKLDIIHGMLRQNGNVSGLITPALTRAKLLVPVANYYA